MDADPDELVLIDLLKRRKLAWVLLILIGYFGEDAKVSEYIAEVLLKIQYGDMSWT